MNSTVYARNYRRGPKWVPGIIVQVKGNNAIFMVETELGILFKRHSNQLQPRIPAMSSDNHLTPNCTTDSAASHSVPAQQIDSHNKPVSAVARSRRYYQRARKQTDFYGTSIPFG